MDKETWAPVCAPFADWYEVSTHGRVRGRKHGRILRPAQSTLRGGLPGYFKVLLSDRGSPRTVRAMSVHRLVAMAFIPGDHALDVNHKDTNKANNHWLNLEWATHAANVQHGLANVPGWRERLREAGLRRRRAVVAALGDATEQFDSITSAALAMGHANKAGNIARAVACGGCAYGRTWRYA